MGYKDLMAGGHNGIYRYYIRTDPIAATRDIGFLSIRARR